MHVELAGRRIEVTGAQLQLYHLESSQADWNLELSLAGEPSRLLLSGTVATPPLPGPSTLDLAFVDDPTEFEAGCLTSHHDGSYAELRVDTSGAHIAGRVRLLWNALAEGLGAASTREIELVLDIDATVI